MYIFIFWVLWKSDVGHYYVSMSGFVVFSFVGICLNVTCGFVVYLFFLYSLIKTMFQLPVGSRWALWIGFKTFDPLDAGIEYP